MRRRRPPPLRARASALVAAALLWGVLFVYARAVVAEVLCCSARPLLPPASPPASSRSLDRSPALPSFSARRRFGFLRAVYCSTPKASLRSHAAKELGNGGGGVCLTLSTPPPRILPPDFRRPAPAPAAAAAKADPSVVRPSPLRSSLQSRGWEPTGEASEGVVCQGGGSAHRGLARVFGGGVWRGVWRRIWSGVWRGVWRRRGALPDELAGERRPTGEADVLR